MLLLLYSRVEKGPHSSWEFWMSCCHCILQGYLAIGFKQLKKKNLLSDYGHDFARGQACDSFPDALDITVQKAVGLYNTWLSLYSLAAGRLSWVRFLQCHYTAELS